MLISTNSSLTFLAFRDSCCVDFQVMWYMVYIHDAQVFALLLKACCMKPDSPTFIAVVSVPGQLDPEDLLLQSLVLLFHSQQLPERILLRRLHLFKDNSNDEAVYPKVIVMLQACSMWSIIMTFVAPRYTFLIQCVYVLHSVCFGNYYWSRRPWNVESNNHELGRGSQFYTGKIKLT